MKLTHKISRYFLFSSVLLFILISVSVYIFNQMTIADEVDEQLVNITKKAEEELRQNKEVNFSPFVEIEKTVEKTGENEFQDVDINIKEGDESEPYRQLVTYQSVDGKGTVTNEAEITKGKSKDDLMFDKSGNFLKKKGKADKA